MLDGCAVTDGVLHFDRAFNADGDIKNIENLSKSGHLLCEVAAL